MSKVSVRYIVADVDAGGCREAEAGHAWDDRLKFALYQLPTHSAWLVGAYLFRNHAEFMASPSQLVDPQIDAPKDIDRVPRVAVARTTQLQHQGKLGKVPLMRPTIAPRSARMRMARNTS